MIKFNQDFTKIKELDKTIWKINTGGFGFGNNELQYYRDGNNNYYLDDLGLHIVGKKEDYDKNHYTSFKASTMIDFKYGKISFEIMLPKLYGSWPAIWMLPFDIKELHWPRCGEIDLMEYALRYPNKVHFSLHSEFHNHKIGTHRTEVKDIDASKFNKFDIYWNEKGFIYFINGKKVTEILRSEDWPFDKPFFLIINMAIGGYFSGYPDENYLKDEFIIKNITITDEVYHD